MVQIILAKPEVEFLSRMNAESDVARNKYFIALGFEFNPNKMA